MAHVVVVHAPLPVVRRLLLHVVDGFRTVAPRFAAVSLHVVARVAGTRWVCDRVAVGHVFRTDHVPCDTCVEWSGGLSDS